MFFTFFHFIFSQCLSNHKLSTRFVWLAFYSFPNENKTDLNFIFCLYDFSLFFQPTSFDINITDKQTELKKDG